MISTSQSGASVSYDGMHVTLNGESAVVCERITPFIGRHIVVSSLTTDASATWSWSNAARIIDSGGTFHS
jgi:hypothetical protein